MNFNSAPPAGFNLDNTKIDIYKVLPIFLFQILFWIFPTLVFSQIDSLAEIISESVPGQEEVNALIEQFSENPMDINSAGRVDLEYFSFLSPAQIDTILESRPFKHKSDLRPLLGQQLYKLFAPFFKVAKQETRFHCSAVLRWQTVVEKNKGLREKIYQGPAGSVYSRLQFEYRPGLSGGLLTQKDAGETSLYDHYAGFLQWQHPGDIFNIIAGTFRIQAGQGLILAAPFGNARGLFPLTCSNFNLIKLSPFLSSGENDGFLGLAGQIGLSRYGRLILFYSSKTKDAIMEKGRILNFATSGYHRTIAEIDGMDVLQEKIAGAGGSVNFNRSLSAGALFLTAGYSSRLDSLNTPAPVTSGNSFSRLSGNPVRCCAFFGQATLLNMHLSAELAGNDFHKFAWQGALSFNFQDQEAGIKWWKIPKDFHSPFGRSFAGSSPFPQSKNGIYLAISLRPAINLPVSAWWTWEKDLWPGFFDPMPLWHKEFAAQTGYQAGKSTFISVKYRYQESYHFTADDQHVSADCLYQFRLQLEKSFLPVFRVRFRLEKMLLSRARTRQVPLQGINLYHDLECRIWPALVLTFRFSSFRLEDYRISTNEYENDLPGSFSSVPVYGKGNKWYLLLKWQISTRWQCWIKYRKFYLDGVKSIGSANDLINSDHRQEIKLQLNLAC